MSNETTLDSFLATISVEKQPDDWSPKIRWFGRKACCFDGPCLNYPIQIVVDDGNLEDQRDFVERSIATAAWQINCLVRDGRGDELSQVLYEAKQ